MRVRLEVCVSAFILALLYAVNVLILKFKLACAMRTRVKECQGERAIRISSSSTRRRSICVRMCVCVHVLLVSF